MGVGIYSALSGINVLDTQLEVAAHNMANISSPGFKQEEVSFSSVLARHGGNGSTANPSTPFVDLGKRQRDFSAGTAMSTGNAMDLSIQGPGFFEISTKQGLMYTRNGAFATDATGTLVDAHGNPVNGAGGPLIIGSGGDIKINEGGVVTVNGEEKGKLKIVDFADRQKLQPVGGTMFAATGLTSSEVASPSVMQGTLESSNSNMVMNLVKLIEISRQQQAYYKVIDAQTRLDQQTASTIGRVS